MDDDAAAVDTNPATTEVAEGDALPATSEAASAAGGDSAGPMDVKQEAGVGEETNDDGEAEMDLSDGEDGEVSERPGPGASGSAYKAPEDVPVKYEYVPVADGTASSVKEPVDSDMASRKRAMPIASKHDRFAKFEARIAADSWDTDAWINLLAEATRRGESSLIQDTYERFLKQFPTSVSLYQFATSITNF